MIIKLMPLQFLHPFALYFLFAVGSTWLTPSIAIDSASQTSLQETAANTEVDEHREITIDDFDANGEVDKIIEIAIDKVETNEKVDEAIEIVIEDFDANGAVDEVNELMTDDFDTNGNVDVVNEAVADDFDGNSALDEVSEIRIDDFDANGKVDAVGEIIFDDYNANGTVQETTVRVADDFDSNGAVEEVRERVADDFDTNGEVDAASEIKIDDSDTFTDTVEITESSIQSLVPAITPNQVKEEKISAPLDPVATDKTNASFTSNIQFNTSFELELKTEKNFNLSNEEMEDISVLEPLLTFDLSYTPSKNISFVVEIEPSQIIAVDQRNKKKDETRLELDKAYLSLKKVIGKLDITVGRQRFKDQREWLYDVTLDGVRLFYGFPWANVEFSVSKKRNKDLKNDGKDEKITNYALYASYVMNKKLNLASYVFAREDNTGKNRSPIFYGLQLYGSHNFGLDAELTDKLKFWFELAHVEGDSGSKKISANGWDLGATYHFNHPLKPAFTFAYAFGSGDDNPSNEVDRNFRQTGLQDNAAKFNGIVRMKYYGEVIDPELDNLVIQTVGFGIWPGSEISVDLVYHLYRQNELSDEMGDSEIDLDPTGLSKELGQEIDLAVGFWGGKRRSKTSLILGEFTPGSAFPGASSAKFLEIIFKRKF